MKRLVEIHKGSIGVESVMGEGSTFRVRLNVTPEAFDPSCRITAAGASGASEPSYRRAVPPVADAP